jgi:hypothetical protein
MKLLFVLAKSINRCPKLSARAGIAAESSLLDESTPIDMSKMVNDPTRFQTVSARAAP